MIKNDGNNEQIYGRNDMVMLNPNNKIYGSLGIADKYVLKTEEGKSLTLSNPKLGKFGDVLTEFNMYGRSEQKSTTGAQLANLLNKNNVTINGVTWTSKDNVVTAIGETGEKVSSTRPEIFYNIPIEPGDYYVSGSTNVVKVIVQFISNSGAYSHHIGDGTFTLTGDERRVTVYLDAVQNSKINDTLKVMLNKGNIALPFESYTGGIPSPSPEYPQEIKSVGDNGSIELNVMGANVLEGTKLGVKSTVNGITYTAYENGILITGTATKDFFIVLHDDTIHPLTHGTYYLTTSGLNSSVFLNLYYVGKFVDDRQNLKVIFNKDVEYSLMLRISKGATINTIVQVSLTKSEITSYEPYYEEQTVTLPYTLNAIPVSSGGNVTIDGQQYIADYVDLKRGKVIRNILKWRPADIKTYINNVVWHMNISKLGIDGSKIGLSNMFKIQNGRYNGVTTLEIYISYDGKIAALNMRGMADEEFKKWLREKNPEVYNVLNVAEEIDLTPEQVQAYKTISIYYPVTTIENNYNTWMKATYKSIESV